jgi:hypothetical protein
MRIGKVQSAVGQEKLNLGSPRVEYGVFKTDTIDDLRPHRSRQQRATGKRQPVEAHRRPSKAAGNGEVTTCNQRIKNRTLSRLGANRVALEANMSRYVCGCTAKKPTGNAWQF